MKRRCIAVLTGTRAEYGILLPVLRAIQAHPRLCLRLIVAGMHWQRVFGSTAGRIRADGFRIAARVPCAAAGDTRAAAALAAGSAVRGCARALLVLRPELLLLLGDRPETLAAAFAANLCGVPVAHIHGGEASGHVDDVLRHAVSKLAHLHFPATQRSARRLRALGEAAWRVTVCGAPALDTMRTAVLPEAAVVRRRYGLPAGGKFALVVQHPVAGAERVAARQLRQTLAAVRAAGLPALVIYPNADPGARAMIAALRPVARRYGWPTAASVPPLDYLALLRAAAVLVGNSSSAIIEAPACGLPAVNIGERQRGRERGGNVQDVPHAGAAITAAVRRAADDMRYRARVRRARNPYGDGRAAARIVRVLAAVATGRHLLEKEPPR